METLQQKEPLKNVEQSTAKHPESEEIKNLNLPSTNKSDNPIKEEAREQGVLLSISSSGCRHHFILLCYCICDLELVVARGLPK